MRASVRAILQRQLLEARARAKARGWDLNDPFPGASAIEDLFRQLEEGAKTGEEVELWVSDRLTLGGRPCQYSMAIEVLRDKALDLGLEFAGYSPGDGGRTFRYRT